PPARAKALNLFPGPGVGPVADGGTPWLGSDAGATTRVDRLSGGWEFGALGNSSSLFGYHHEGGVSFPRLGWTEGGPVREPGTTKGAPHAGQVARRPASESWASQRLPQEQANRIITNTFRGYPLKRSTVEPHRAGLPEQTGG